MGTQREGRFPDGLQYGENFMVRGQQGKPFRIEMTLGHDDKIQGGGNERLIEANAFPQNALDPVTHDCFPDFFGDGHADSPVQIIGRTKIHKHYKMFGIKTATLIIAEREVGSPEQSVPPRPG